ncbi:hypothetical protein [Mucilaginibacter psychrotolerans]|uniref:Uncharacterized protein n=1 Tax=Mucilaginibacter psychrotolerans TaxID=1524096 RepID=A0A4Y8SKX2_9SPHI|nr:hypothetical protein [Mucilaginibacter psychrotolerans]TFF39280.1 hypothetical protein E2R66_06580 [Mucilaginibacter psychrotolerans]
MSLDLQVFTKTLDDNLIPEINKQLNNFDMVVEVHPDFTFTTPTGFLPFKFKFNNPKFKVLEGKDLISGFELYKDDFSLAEKLEELNPKKGFMGKLLSKKTPEETFAPPEFEKRLANCTKEITFVWHVGDTFELRFAALTSAILTKLTDGVCCYPADDIWYDNDKIVENAYKEVKEYEDSLKEKDLKFHLFTKWE